MVRRNALRNSAHTRLEGHEIVHIVVDIFQGHIEGVSLRSLLPFRNLLHLH